MKRFLITTSILLTSLAIGMSAANAQSIAVDALDEAQAYDPGLLSTTTGGLDAGLWQGTTADQAARLLSNAPVTTPNPFVQDLIKAAALSAGVPPEAATPDARAAYNRAKIATVMTLADTSAVDQLLARNPDLSNDPRVKVDIALRREDISTLCSVTDSVQEGRANPEWARLRAFCHVVRDETAAAELTRNLLRNTGYEDKTYHTLMDILLGGKKPSKFSIDSPDPLYPVMALQAGLTSKTPSPTQAATTALSDETPPDERLIALYAAGNALTQEQVGRVLSSLAVSGTEPEPFIAPSFTLETALKADAPQAMGQLYTLARAGGDSAVAAKAISEILSRAEQAGAEAMFINLLSQDIQVLPARLQAATDLKRFTALAIARNDIGTLQGFYQALAPGSPAQTRIALVSDALANGFILGDLGKDIEARLQESGETQARAVRDTVLAVAQGAQLSGSAAEVLTTTNNDEGRTITLGDKLSLSAAAKRGSRAETVLRVAILIGDGDITDLSDDALYTVIRALNEAGLTRYAGQAAAEDFLAGL